MRQDGGRAADDCCVWKYEAAIQSIYASHRTPCDAASQRVPCNCSALRRSLLATRRTLEDAVRVAHLHCALSVLPACRRRTRAS